MRSRASVKSSIFLPNVRSSLICALLATGCGGTESSRSDGPGSGSATPPGSIGSPAAVDSSSDTLGLARRLAVPVANLHRLLSATGDHAFRVEDDSFVSPSWDETGIDRFRQVAARLPARSADVFTIGLGRIARFGLGLKLEGARDVSAVLREGSVVYRDAYRSTDVLWATVDDRAEELLLLRRPDAPREFSWHVALPRGLTSVRREESGAVLFADRRGDGVLRIPPPFAIDARGTRRDATLAWSDGRLAVSVDTSGLEYPVLVDPAVEIVQWEKKTPKTTTPTPREGPAMAYDSARGQTIVFGGGDVNGPIGETWGWDGDDWAPIAVGTTPARVGMAIVYDPVANIDFAFGSCAADTWALGAATWSTLAPADSPIGGQATAMAYDGPPSAGGRGKVVLFAGHECKIADVNVNETWEWNGTNWTQLFPSSAPLARGLHAMVYDLKRHETLMFGGAGDQATCGDCFFDDTWTWDGSAWDKKAPTKKPPGRYAHAMVYDSAVGRTVLFGGNNGPFLGDTWEWDGTNWKETTPSTSPPVRYYHAMAYDSARGRVVLFGGQGEGGDKNDTWEYHSHGDACVNDTECDTGHCVDGVCCEQSSCGQCEACDTVVSPGVCAPVKYTQDDSCNDTMACDPAGICTLYVGTPCTGTVTSAPKGLFCVDGYNCRTACNGQCEACDVPTSLGTCVAVTGKPHPSHSPCTGTGTACGGVCGGTDRTACVYPGSSKSCRTAGCANATITAAAGCDGAGLCPAPQTTSCGVYACDAGGTAACETGCTGDSQCSSTAYCDAPSCVAKLPLADPCPLGDKQCLSGHCADGVCCDTACNGQCEACNVGGIDGICQAVSGDPVGTTRAQCTGKGTTCGGTCDGTNQATCTYPKTNVSCRAASCSNDVGTLAAFCDGAGTCPLTTKDCLPLGCKDSTACATDCDLSTPCQSGYFCDSGICRTLLTPGDPCPLGDSSCGSGHCVDGVCCDTACLGQCEACNVLAGTCIPITGAPANGRPACGGGGTKCAGTCGGTDRNACTYPDSTTECRAPTCASSIAILRAGCDGNGACPPVQTQACAPYICGATQCLGDCPNGDIDCQAGKFCSAGVCKDKLPIPATCGADTQCVSGHCADGVCCNTDCQGLCEFCKEPNKEGTCTLVQGVPRGGRSACPGTGTCKAECDGKTAASCTYPDSTVVCTPAGCTNGVETAASVCNGSGACSAPGTTDCGAYACVADHCATSCTGRADCSSDSWCSSGSCVPLASGGAGGGGSSGAAGAGATAGGGPGGAGGSGGSSGSGTAATSGSAGVASPDAGSGTGGSGSFAEPVATQDSGCGCRTAQSGSQSSAAGLCALALVAALGRRSRKRRLFPRVEAPFER